MLGLRDYVRKNGFRHVALALSGGIDSALVALIAVDALGARGGDLRRHALPPLQRRDTAGRAPIAANLGTELVEIPIGAMMGDYAQALDGAIGGSVDGAGPVPGPGTRPVPPDPTWTNSGRSSSPRRTSRRGSAAT